MASVVHNLLMYPAFQNPFISAVSVTWQYRVTASNPIHTYAGYAMNFTEAIKSFANAAKHNGAVSGSVEVAR